MNKPYIICHMMTSVDGRIDCAMTEHLPGVQEYYDTLDSLNAPTRVSGRVTAELELAGPGVFHSETVTPFGREGFSKKTAAAANIFLQLPPVRTDTAKRAANSTPAAAYMRFTRAVTTSGFTERRSSRREYTAKKQSSSITADRAAVAALPVQSSTAAAESRAIISLAAVFTPKAPLYHLKYLTAK